MASAINMDLSELKSLSYRCLREVDNLLDSDDFKYMLEALHQIEESPRKSIERFSECDGPDPSPHL
jgi:hypothetical protein